MNGIVIQTREKPDDKGWWCNGTINGYDVSFESENRLEAVKMMIDYLFMNNIRYTDCKWERPLYYNTAQALK